MQSASGRLLSWEFWQLNQARPAEAPSEIGKKLGGCTSIINAGDRRLLYVISVNAKSTASYLRLHAPSPELRLVSQQQCTTMCGPPGLLRARNGTIGSRFLAAVCIACLLPLLHGRRVTQVPFARNDTSRLAASWEGVVSGSPEDALYASGYLHEVLPEIESSEHCDTYSSRLAAAASLAEAYKNARTLANLECAVALSSGVSDIVASGASSERLLHMFFAVSIVEVAPVRTPPDCTYVST